MEAEPRARKSLIEGVRMRCPRCEELFPLLAWKPMEEKKDYAHETTPIYKCRKSMVSLNRKKGCGFLFAPVESNPSRVFIDEE